MMMLPARRAWWGNQGMADNVFHAGMGSISLGVNKSIFYVGETPTYVIQGAAASSPIAWSSTKNGLSTGENLSNYNQTTDANGNLVGAGSPWTAADIGTWTKTVTVNGENYTTTFQVLPLSGEPALGTGSGTWLPYYGPAGGATRATAPAAADNINIFGYDVPRIPFYIVLVGLVIYLVKGKR